MRVVQFPTVRFRGVEDQQTASRQTLPIESTLPVSLHVPLDSVQFAMASDASTKGETTEGRLSAILRRHILKGCQTT